MGVYVITNGDGSYIHRDDTSGKYVTIKSFKRATQWDSVMKANSILNNSVPKTIRNSYAVQLIETEHIVEKENTAVQKELCFCEASGDDNISEWLEKINAIKEILSGSDARQQELCVELSEVDKEIVDVEHYIEFGKFNAYQGWMCFKMLQNLLRKRRKVKNEQQVLMLIKSSKINKDSVIALSQTVSDITNKCYTPRAFPELFRSGK